MGKARATSATGSRKPASSTRGREGAAWLLAGPEAGRRAEFVESIASSIAKRTGAPPERHRFHGFDARTADVVMVLSNGSLFSAHRLVILSEADLVKRKEDVDRLAAWLAAPSEDATLVLETDEVVTARMREAPVSAAIFKLIPEDHQKVFWEMFDSDKRGWIVNFFRQRGLSLGPGVVEHILDMVENNTRDLRAECDPLATFFVASAAGTIDLERLEHYLYHGKGENVFTLFDRLATRDFPAAEEVLEKILLSRGDEAEPTALAAGLLWQFRRLATIKRLLDEERYDASEAFEKARVWGKRNQQTHQAAVKSYTLAELERITECLLELDVRLRSLRADLHPLLLQMAVYYITRRGGAGAWRTVA